MTLAGRWKSDVWYDGLGTGLFFGLGFAIVAITAFFVLRVGGC